MSVTSAEQLAPATVTIPDVPAVGTLRVRPKVGWQPIDLGELWHYRELLWIIAARDIKVRYKQTALGFAWAFIQPFATTVVFSIIGSLGHLDTGGVPRPLFVLCGLLPWLLFANAINAAGNSLVGNQHLITKVYFPRLVMPIASIVTSLVDFGISLLMLVVLMAWYHVLPGPQVLLLPVFVVLSFTAALSGGLWLSALNVEYRDVRYVVPLAVNVAQFVTPMTGIVEGFRWCLIPERPPGPLALCSSVGIILVLLVGGLYYFRRMEKSFADLV